MLSHGHTFILKFTLQVCKALRQIVHFLLRTSVHRRTGWPTTAPVPRTNYKTVPSPSTYNSSKTKPMRGSGLPYTVSTQSLSQKNPIVRKHPSPMGIEITSRKRMTPLRSFLYYQKFHDKRSSVTGIADHCIHFPTHTPPMCS